MAERPLRIALLEPAGRGGICHYARGLATALARRSGGAVGAGRPLEVTLFTARDFEFAGLELPFRVERVFDRWRTSPLAVLAALRRLRPDVLHLQSGTHPALHLALAVAARAATGAPLLVTAHDVVPKNATRLDALLCRGLYRAADAVVVHGESLARTLAARFGGARAKIRVIPHGEYGFLRPAPARARGGAPPTLLFFGYLHAEKGLPDLIEALPAVAREIAGVRVVIAGTPELDVEPLRARAAALGVLDRIDWRLRYVGDEERDELFAAATALVLPYRDASQSGVAFLAGAWEKPVVATRVGALPELVADGVGGLLVPPRSPGALASGILRLLRDPAAARRMGREHGRRCRELGSWDGIAGRTAELYGELTRIGGEEGGVTRLQPTRARAARLPRVTVIMPVRDEAATIGGALRSLLAQDYPRARLELLVLDGRSTDDTRERVRAIARRDRRVRLLDNPGRVVATALNLGFLRARGAIVARADGHTRYAPDYVRAAVRAFEESGADVVGGPMLPGRCRTPFERAAARALTSRFGMGGAAFHFDGASGPAESVYLGVYRADALHRFGPFDESLVRNQDDEWFARARARGARIFLDPRLRSAYRPRGTARRLFRQYFEYGLYKPAALRRVAGSFRWRHAAPSALLLALAAPPCAGAWAAAGAAALAYLVALLAVSARLAAGEQGEPRARATARQAAVFALMHGGYGLGFLAGLLRRAPDSSRAGIRAVYARYAADPRARRRWDGGARGQAALLAERDRALADRLRARFGPRPRRLRILDLGSGERDLAAVLAGQGIAGARVVAVDLLAERLAGSPARARAAADGRLLPFRDGSFDAVVQCAMLSSLPAEAARRLVAAEMVRVCRPDGLLLSYDARLPNPFNRRVRRVSRREHRELFDGCRVEFEPLTVVPPLARLAPTLAPKLAQVEALQAFDLAAIEPAPARESR